MLERRTKETSVKISLDLEGAGNVKAATGVKFLDHMLESFATHSLIDLKVDAEGDLQHHVVEDVAICLGQTLDKALNDRAGIRRFGYAIVPMDDALVVAAVDLVRRPFAAIRMQLERVMIEDVPREDVEHFLPSLTVSLQATTHVRVLDGSNDHHKMEASVKAFALALRDAIAFDPRRGSRLPSSKGVA